MPEPESELAALVADAPGMPVVLGSVLLFGPRRGQYVVVRQLLPSVALLGCRRPWRPGAARSGAVSSDPAAGPPT